MCPSHLAATTLTFAVQALGGDARWVFRLFSSMGRIKMHGTGMGMGMGMGDGDGLRRSGDAEEIVTRGVEGRLSAPRSA